MTEPMPVTTMEVVSYNSDLSKLSLVEVFQSLDPTFRLTPSHIETRMITEDQSLSDTTISRSRMDEELKQTEDRTKEIERLMEELKSEREDLVRRSGVIRSARAIFFSDQTKAKATPQGSAVSDEQILRAVTGIEADKFQYLSIGQAILAVLKYNENKWTPISEFAAEFKKRGKNVSYASIDQTIRGSKLSEKLENKKEGNRNFFRLKQ